MTSAVVCVGLATRDTILVVPRHPGPDDRVVASELAVAGGGPAATAAVALARLGVETAFVGAVGDDEPGAAIRDDLAAEGVDVSHVSVVAGARSPQSTILVGPGGTRAIVTVRGPELRLDPNALELCRAAEWVHVDHAGWPAVAPARDGLRLSVDDGNPITGLELDGVALYAPTESALRDRFPGLEPEEAARAARAAGTGLVVVTRGAEGSAALSLEGEWLVAPGQEVEAVSTLGAGDVFHGALLAALVRGRPLAEALHVANVCAALSCRSLDGRSAIPGPEALGS